MRPPRFLPMRPFTAFLMACALCALCTLPCAPVFAQPSPPADAQTSDQTSGQTSDQEAGQASKQAQRQPQWMLGGGGRFSTSPYKAYTSWSPAPLLGYEGEYVYVRGLEVGIKVFSRPWLELSAFGAYDPTSFHTRYTDNRQLKKLDERYESALAGVAARVNLPFGVLRAKVAADVLGHSGGWLAEAGYGYRWQWGALEVSPSAGLRWYSSRYQEYYYGVSATESARSGLRRYDPESGLDPYAGLRLGYSLAEHWNILGGVDAALLNSQIQNSPMTDKGMRLTTYLGVVYMF